MRSCPTDSERALWGALRCRQLGVEFRQQVVVGGRLIADFLAPGPRLVVEVDGGCHRDRRRADARRDAKLGRLGYRVLRVEAERVVADLAGVVAEVSAALAEEGRRGG
jgi:very-short-patch-repair endonuclease